LGGFRPFHDRGAMARMRTKRPFTEPSRSVESDSPRPASFEPHAAPSAQLPIQSTMAFPDFVRRIFVDEMEPQLLRPQSGEQLVCVNPKHAELLHVSRAHVGDWREVDRAIPSQRHDAGRRRFSKGERLARLRFSAAGASHTSNCGRPRGIPVGFRLP
jgi:hypothetical protein